MIECKVKEKEICVIEAQGTGHQICNDVLNIIHTLYDGFYKNDPGVANVFRVKLIGYLVDPDGTVWKPEA